MKTIFDNKNYIESNYSKEKVLMEIFQTQYNDIFHNILNYDKNKMMMLLQEQVYLNLKLLNLKIEYSLIQQNFSLFLDKYLKEKEEVNNIYKIIKNNEGEIIYLDYLNCFIHCTKCKNALHKCGQKFIVFNDYVFCLYCKEVYNEFQVHMYCKECKEQYYTKLREIKNENDAYIFPVCYEKYHCPLLGFDEKIKCNKCKNDLFCDINSNKNKNKINEIFCKKCKVIYDVNLINSICLNCKCNFKSDVNIYNYFPPIKIDLLTIIHCLFNRKFALPLIISNKQCRCDLSKIEILKHNDGGDLLEGDIFDTKVIICNRCFSIFNLESFEWECPICKKDFESKKDNIYEYKLKETNKINNDNKNSNKILFVSHYENLNNFIYHSPMSKNQEINKNNYDINYNNKYFSGQNSIKKINNRINNFNKKENENKKRVYKSSKSVSYIEEKEDTKKVPKKYSCEKYNSRNDIRNEFINKNEAREYNTDKYRSIYVIKNKNNNRNILSEINNNSSINHQRTNINIKKIETADKNDNSKNLYNIYNKAKNIEEISDVNKNLFLEKNDINNKRNDNLIRKNFSVTNSLVVKNKRDNGIMSARNILKNSNKDNSKIIKKAHIKNNIIKTIESLNNKSNININQSNIINNNNKGKIFNKMKYNNNKMHINKKFDSYKCNNINNISINIKINNSNNNIINVNNNLIDSSRIKKANLCKTDKKYIKHKEIIKKNYINLKSNLNHSIQKNFCNNKRKNHIHIISELDNNNNNMTQNNIKKIESKINNNIYMQNISSTNLYDTNNNLNQNHNLIKNHSSIQNNIKISDNSLQKQNNRINIQKNNINAIKEKEIFHSDDYNIIDLIGEGTYGKIYLVKKNKTNEIYALKQISIKRKIDSNKYKKEYEFLMKLTEDDPSLNIVNILGIEVKQLDKFNTVLYILMEAGKSDWEKEVYKRNLEQKYYTENELIDILASLVSTFSSLQKKGISHRDVKPQNIVFFEKNKNRKKNMYKITDFGEAKINKNKKVFNVAGFDKNTSKQTVRGTELYMSPLLFNALRNTGEIDIQYNPYKSDVYSLGLCILLAASLSYIPLYQIREINKMDKIKNIIEGYLTDTYSKEFINLLLVMLQINEKFRPDFIELNSWIENHYY